MTRSSLSTWSRWSVLIALAGVTGGGGLGCQDELPLDVPMVVGRFAGQVVVSGGLRGARVTVDQLDIETGEARLHVGDAVTDDAGRFSFETGTQNGVLLVSARGGTYRDLATGATVHLDDTDEIRSLVWHEILDLQDDALVSPIGHMIEARTRARRAALADTITDPPDKRDPLLWTAYQEATAMLNRHFGNVHWGEIQLWPLDQPADSPIEPVRAAFVHAALSVLASDIAADASAGPQEVNVFKLMRRWTDDVYGGPFDGNDGNDRTPGSGLQLGYCPPVDPMCVVPATGCAVGSCRRLCDLYAGTPRALLAGAMTKVIRDRGPGGINSTGLDLDNTLSIVRQVSDDKEPALFADACVEELDRLPPTLHFDPPTPADASFVRGQIELRASAVDDIDLSPDVSIVGVMDEDGDPRNAVAIGRINTPVFADGPLTVTARATDLAGNTVTLVREVTIDNTAPAIALDVAGFFLDGATWWTASAAPLLTGTVVDAAPLAIKAVLPGGVEVAGVVSGTIWRIQLPAGALDPGGTTIQIVATDAAGNQAAVMQRLRPDVEPPVLSFQPSTVNDEAAELVTFAADHSPQHAHIGAPVDLTVAGSCPSVTKFSSLLGSTAPEYGTESPGPNPIRYQLVTDDPGVGIAAGSTEYRVGRRVGTSTTWILDWTPAGAGIPIATGVTRFPIGIFSDVVAGLAAEEGIYDVELRATDRLARTTTAARCFDLHLRAAPLEFEMVSGTRPTKDHQYSLDSLKLEPGSPYDKVAALLLNDDAIGASLIDQDVWNGTTQTVYLTVTVTKPAIVDATQSYVIDNAAIDVTQCGSPGTPPCPGTTPSPPVTAFVSMPQMTPKTTAHYPAKVFEIVAGEPTTEIPCLAPCPPSGSVFKFAIPPRGTGNQPARTFRVMTMIGQVTGLWPTSGGLDVLPPFFDDLITWTRWTTGIPIPMPITRTTRLTGIIDRTPAPERHGCVYAPASVCTHEGTIVPYRALRSASLTFATASASFYATAATATLPAVQATFKTRSSIPANNWSTAEGGLPQFP